MCYFCILYCSFISVLLSAKPRPSKKAWLNKPADDNTAVEPEKTPDPENADAILDDPPPQDHDFVADQVEVDPMGQSDEPTNPVRNTDKPAADKPSTPVKAADGEEDDIMITGIGHTTPGNPVALSKHTAKDSWQSYRQRQVECRFVKLCPSQCSRPSLWLLEPSVHQP